MNRKSLPDKGIPVTTVLLAGATGQLGNRIAGHLLADDTVTLRLLLRDVRPADPGKRAAIDGFTAGGAEVAIGRLDDPASLGPATRDVDVIVSAVQGGAEVIVDGQVALATAGQRNGVRRFVPSDFALDIFAAPREAPTLALRRDAAGALEATGLDVVHVLNGGFMDMMLAAGGGMIDLKDPRATYWGSGNEPFDLTTVDDTARFAAALSADDTATGGVYRISGSRTSVNAISDGIEQRTGRPVPRRSLGALTELARRLGIAGDPWSHVMDWYTLALFTTPPFETTDNDRYPAVRLASLDDYLDAALLN
jgi:uncharacterized protein YbjT (DUF2867 family)